MYPVLCHKLKCLPILGGITILPVVCSAMDARNFPCPFACGEHFATGHGAEVHAGMVHRNRKRGRLPGVGAEEEIDVDNGAGLAPAPAFVALAGVHSDAARLDLGILLDGDGGELGDDDDVMVGAEDADEALAANGELGDDDNDADLFRDEELEEDWDLDDVGNAVDDGVAPADDAALAADHHPVAHGLPPVDVGMYSTSPDDHKRPVVGTWSELGLGGILYRGCTREVADAIVGLLKDPRFKPEDLSSAAQCVRLVKKQMESDCPALRVQRTPVSFAPGTHRLPAWKGAELAHHGLAPLIARALTDGSITEWEKLLRFDPAVARAILESPEGPDDPVDEPMYTRANLRLMLERFEHFKSLGYAEDDILMVGFGVQWDAMRPDQVGNLKLDQIVMVCIVGP